MTGEVFLPRVSILVAAHAPNRIWLDQAIQSALDQRGCSIEVIVVDDGSPEPIADDLAAAREQRVTTLRTAHQGEGAARNAGVRAATGDWIRFLDADDVLPLDSTARLLDTLDGDRSAVAAGSTLWCNEDLEPLYRVPARGPRAAAVDCLLCTFTIMVPAMLFPADLVRAAGPWVEDVRVGADWDFQIRALERGQLCVGRSDTLLYRQHAGSISRDVEEGRHGTLLGVQRYLERHPEVRGTPLERRARAMLMMTEADHVSPGRPWRSVEFRRALRTDARSARIAYQRAILPRIGRGRQMMLDGAGDPRRALRSRPALRSALLLGRELSRAAIDTPRRSRQQLDHTYSTATDPWRYGENPDERERHRVALEALDCWLVAPRDAAILEIGCGEGHFTETLAPRCATVLAVDLSDLALERARTRLAPRDNVRFTQLDLRRDEIPGRFEAAVTMDVLDVLYRPRDFRGAVARVVAATSVGGIVLVSAKVQGDAIERAMWARLLPRGASNIIAAVGRHPSLGLVDERATAEHQIAVFRVLERR